MQFVHSQKETTAALLLFPTKNDPKECHSIVVVVDNNIIIIIIMIMRKEGTDKNESKPGTAKRWRV